MKGDFFFAFYNSGLGKRSVNKFDFLACIAATRFFSKRSRPQREIVATLDAETNVYGPFSFYDKLSVENLNRSNNNESGFETTHIT